MEVLHGVDVSWLHKPGKDGTLVGTGYLKSDMSPGAIVETLSNSPQPSPRGSNHVVDKTAETKHASRLDDPFTTVDENLLKATTQLSAGVGQDSSKSKLVFATKSKTEQSEPGLTIENSKGGPRRGSWLTTLSSKFTSPTQLSPTHASVSQTSRPITVELSPGSAPKLQLDTSRVISLRHTGHSDSAPEYEPSQPYVPQKPKESSGGFFSNLTRRLSSGTQGVTATPKAPSHNGILPRRTLNVNVHRHRCLLPELEPLNLRRVAFSVDVEVAGPPKYPDEESGSKKSKKQKEKDKKALEQSEAIALKTNDGAGDAKDMDAAVSMTHDEKDSGVSKLLTRKQEKKKRSEEERKERKERKRKKAEENGTLPIERNGSIDIEALSHENGHEMTAKINDRPTTDPVRIYRRCCQLRESPILKRITEQLAARDVTNPDESGTVQCLDLRGSRLQVTDYMTLGDWLAIVPVKKLLLDDADLSDEGLRVVLAGLLTTKKTSEVDPQCGVIEKLHLNDNPRITPVGWRYITLFLHMSRSIQTVNLSKLKFPIDFPSRGDATASPAVTSPTTTIAASRHQNVIDLFAKALSERPGGARLEEMVMTECDLSADQIGKIVKAAEVCGIARLGFGGSRLDDSSLEHIYHFIRSGVCTTVDLGGNDLRGRTEKLADALTYNADCPVWGLSLASCNLDGASLKVLCPAMCNLKHFRFLDISHNTALFANDSSDGMGLLREYLPQLGSLKRMHLSNVDLSARQAISLAEVLPDGPQLAHVNLLNNAALRQLITSRIDTDQQEACALFASLMSAVRVSRTIICIDIDVPPSDTNEVVKALARQVVAYCLRNMEYIPVQVDRSVAATELTKPHVNSLGGALTFPDVLVHLISHDNDIDEAADEKEATPDDDYIVGGGGVAKALQYCLDGKPPASPNASPRVKSKTDVTTPGRGRKAKEVSKNLLGSARMIHARLKTALAKEAAAGNQPAYRRLVYLEETLQRMIQRFEFEYPECRVTSVTQQQRSESVTSAESADMSDATPTGSEFTLQIPRSNHQTYSSDDDDDDASPARPSTRNSQVSLASRVLSIEEGCMHKLGLTLGNDRRESLEEHPPISSRSFTPHALPPHSEISPSASETTPVAGPERAEETAQSNVATTEPMAEYSTT